MGPSSSLQILFRPHNAFNFVGHRLSEVAVPYYIFRANGYDVTLSSLEGGEIPVDQAGLSDQEKASHPELGMFLADGTRGVRANRGLE